ncbi:MAG: hypothetical protein WC091_04455 [Sulfuricellaceae bacterium]
MLRRIFLKSPAIASGFAVNTPAVGISLHRQVDIGEYRVVYDYSDEALRILRGRQT